MRKNEKIKNIPVIIFTVLEKSKTEQKAKECKAACVINKPFDAEEIIRVLKEKTDKKSIKNNKL